MSSHPNFDDLFQAKAQSGNNSEAVSDNSTPPLEELSKQKSLNIPVINIKKESIDEQLSRSLDFKKQVSRSLGTGGIVKPRSRRSSFKSNDSDDEDDGNERKRRDNINERIQELLTLIPPEFFQLEKESTINEDGEVQIKNSGTRDGKPNKGQILTNSVKYIKYLQDVIDENNRTETELMLRLNALNPNISLGVCSAEKALGEIGVGNYSDKYFKEVLKKTISNNKVGRSGSFS